MISATVPLVAGCTGPSGPPDRVATIANDAAKGAEGTLAELRINVFGRRSLSAGERFYIQSDGTPAMWVQLNRPVEGLDATIWLGDKPLQRTAIQRNVVTGTIPASLNLAAGRYPLQLRWSAGGARGGTPSVDFVVEPGHPWDHIR